MECRLLLASAVAMLLLLLAFATPCDSLSPCPEACDYGNRVFKCASYIPEVDWLSGFWRPDWFDELWLDKIDTAVLANHSRRVDCSRSDVYCSRVEAFTLTRYGWAGNESAALDLAAKFISGFPALKHLNVSHNDFKNIDWIRSIRAPNLTSFNASHNQLYAVRDDTFGGMTELAELVLSDNQLHQLDAAFETLRKLQLFDVSNNQIVRLNDVLTRMPDLRRLNLAGNKISFVQSNYFQDLRSLVELDISRNAFVFILPESLQSLTSLSVLNLSENRLIERDLSLLLDSVRRLEVVDASRIGLWRVPATLTRSVKIMKLVGNQLTAINSGDFDSYPLLQFLDLSGNKLIMIEDDALGRLDELKELYLYGNILSSVPKSLPSNLEILDLRQNTITTVNANDLRGLGNLRKLDLSGNVVSSIENGAFRHLTGLSELDISDNPIKRLTADALRGSQVLYKLRMAGLTEFKLDENQNQDTAFPYSEPEFLHVLDLSRSPSLAALFLADNATLKACKHLRNLDLSNTNASLIRNDLHYVLPELLRLYISGIDFDCKKWFSHCHEHDYISFEGIRIDEARTTTTSRPTQPTATTTLSSTTIARVQSSSKSQLKKEFDMLVKPTATPPTTTVAYTTTTTTTTTDLPTTKVEDRTSTTQLAKTFATTQTRTKIQEVTTPSTISTADPSSTYYGEERPDLFTLREAKTNRAKAVKKKTTTTTITTPVEDNQSTTTTTTTRLPSTARLVPSRRRKATRTTTTRTTTMRTTTEEDDDDDATEAPPAIINLENDMTTTIYDESNLKLSSHVFSDFSRSKVLLANDEDQASAEELINDRGHRHSDFFSNGAHPGMLILVGAVVGAAAALTVVLSRRATAKGREQYHRQENIALTPTSEQRW